jgi:hypothetical protein
MQSITSSLSSSSSFSFLSSSSSSSFTSSSSSSYFSSSFDSSSFSSSSSSLSSSSSSSCSSSLSSSSSDTLSSLSAWEWEYLNEEEDRLGNRTRHKNYIPRIALTSSLLSCWTKVFESGHEGAMITFTGLDFPSFNFLSVPFEVLYNTYTPWPDKVSDCGKLLRKRKYGVFNRPRSLDSRGCLALVLAHLRTRGCLIALGQKFGIIYTITCKYLRFGRRLFITVLKSIRGARIAMPCPEDVELFKTVVSSKYPMLHDVWFVVDGLKLTIAEPTIGHIQRRFYNGWTADHEVSSVLAFTPDGVIAACCLNQPGSWHDSIVAEYGNLFQKFENHCNLVGGRGVVDSAFSRRRYEFLIKSSQEAPVGADAATVALNRQATSLRQTAEWGMRAIQSSFPRLKDDIFYEEYNERYLLLLSVVHFYNFRVRYVGINQIRTVFLPHLDKSLSEYEQFY